MFTEIKKEFQEGKTRFEFIASELADIAKLPTSKTNDPYYKANGVAPGSACLCTEDSSFHVLGADDVWHRI